MPKYYEYIRFPCGDSPFVACDQDGAVVYRKELAYPGKFVKVNDMGEQEFELSVDEDLIDHWVRTFDDMKAEGIPVPVPVGHTTNPEARRGTVIKMSKEINDRGMPALFCYVQFRSPEVAEQFKDSDVSLFMPPSFTHGQNKKFDMPIRHVALTDYPVIPRLGRFKAAIAASLIECSGEDMNDRCTWTEVAEALGVHVGEGEDAKEAVMQAWDASPGEGGEGSGEGEEFVDPGEGSEMGSGEDSVNPEVFEGEGGEGEEELLGRRGGGNYNYEPPPSLSLSHPNVRMVCRARETEIDQLLHQRKITAPQAKALKAKFASRQSVAFALSLEDGDDDFENTMSLFGMGASYGAVGEHTGDQRNHEGGELSPLAKDAAKRAAAAKARRQ